MSYSLCLTIFDFLFWVNHKHVFQIMWQTHIHPHKWLYLVIKRRKIYLKKTKNYQNLPVTVDGIAVKFVMSMKVFLSVLLSFVAIVNTPSSVPCNDLLVSPKTNIKYQLNIYFQDFQLTFTDKDFLVWFVEQVVRIISNEYFKCTAI